MHEKKKSYELTEVYMYINTNKDNIKAYSYYEEICSHVHIPSVVQATHCQNMWLCGIATVVQTLKLYEQVTHFFPVSSDSHCDE